MKKSRFKTIKSWLDTIAAILTIIMFIYGLRTCNKTTGDTKNNNHSTIVTEKQTPEYISEHKIWANMTTWDKIFLPFIEHKKMNYHEHEWNEKGWRVYIGYLAIIGLLLIGILACGALSLGYLDGAGSGNLYGKIFFGIIAILLLIYLILRILAQIGRF